MPTCPSTRKHAPAAQQKQKDDIDCFRAYGAASKLVIAAVQLVRDRHVTQVSHLLKTFPSKPIIHPFPARSSRSQTLTA